MLKYNSSYAPISYLWVFSKQVYFQLIGYVIIHLFLAKPLEDLNALKIAFQVYFFREIEQMVFCCHDFTGENYTHWCHGECLYEQTRNRTHDWSNFPYETHKILHAKNKYNFLLFSLSLFFASLLFCIFLLQFYYREDRGTLVFKFGVKDLYHLGTCCHQLLDITFKHASTTPPFLFEETWFSELQFDMKLHDFKYVRECKIFERHKIDLKCLFFKLPHLTHFLLFT